MMEEILKNEALIRFKADFCTLDGVFGEMKYNGKYCIKEFSFADEHHKLFNINGIVVEQVVCLRLAPVFRDGMKCNTEILTNLDIYIDHSNSEKPYHNQKHLDEIINFELYDHEITCCTMDNSSRKIKITKDYVYDFIMDGVPVEELDEELEFEADRFRNNNYVDYLTAEIVWAIIKDTTDQASIA